MDLMLKMWFWGRRTFRLLSLPLKYSRTLEGHGIRGLYETQRSKQNRSITYLA